MFGIWRCNIVSQSLFIAFFGLIFHGLICIAIPNNEAHAQEPATYVGSEACKECHEQEHYNFTHFAKKAKSAHSIKIMAPKLTKQELEGCFSCHTTGYGKPGGFTSFEATPHLADAGCEVCHGPGSAHIEEGGDPEYISSPTLEGCKTCHNEERIENFDFRPLMHAGAH